MRALDSGLDSENNANETEGTRDTAAVQPTISDRLQPYGANIGGQPLLVACNQQGQPGLETLYMYAYNYTRVPTVFKGL